MCNGSAFWDLVIRGFALIGVFSLGLQLQRWSLRAALAPNTTEGRTDRA